APVDHRPAARIAGASTGRARASVIIWTVLASAPRFVSTTRRALAPATPAAARSESRRTASAASSGPSRATNPPPAPISPAAAALAGAREALRMARRERQARRAVEAPKRLEGREHRPLLPRRRAARDEQRLTGPEAEPVPRRHVRIHRERQIVLEVPGHPDARLRRAEAADPAGILVRLHGDE